MDWLVLKCNLNFGQFWLYKNSWSIGWLEDYKSIKLIPNWFKFLEIMFNVSSRSSSVLVLYLSKNGWTNSGLKLLSSLKFQKKWKFYILKLDWLQMNRRFSEVSWTFYQVSTKIFQNSKVFWSHCFSNLLFSKFV